MRPLVLFQGITLPGWDPGPPSLTLQVRCRGGAPAGAGASLHFPRSPPDSTSRRARRPRLGGGLSLLPRGPTRVDLELDTAPPHARGPLFASPGRHLRRLRGDWRRVTWPPASLRASHRRGSAATLRPGWTALSDPVSRRAASWIAVRDTPGASSKPQGFSSQSRPPQYRAQTKPMSRRGSAA
jgi:hypothetical protein